MPDIMNAVASYSLSEAKGLTEVINLDDWDEGETFHYSIPPNIDGMLVLFDPAKTTKQLIKSKASIPLNRGKSLNINYNTVS